MSRIYKISLSALEIGSYRSVLSVCRDGYSLSESPVPGFDTSEVLARVNECRPLTSTDGSYQSEILKSIFNIGLKTAESKPLWITPNSIRHRRHNPLEHSGKESSTGEMSPDECTLHRRFASLVEKDEKAILNFANKYGLLRHHPVHDLVFRDSVSGKQAQLGESCLWWQEEIADLATCLKLWDLVSTDDKELRDIVLWHRDGITLRLDESDIHVVGRRNMNLLTRWQRGDLKGPALYYISLETDRRLFNALTPRVLDLDDRQIYFLLDSLLSAIWLTFLMEISGGTRPLQCRICGEYFNSHDPRARFCSTRCRMRNHRHKQKSKRRRKVKSGQRT